MRRSRLLVIPIIIALVFIVLCLTFDLHEILFYLDGGLMSVAERVFTGHKSSDVLVLNWAVNFSLSVLFLFLYIQAKRMFTQILFSMISFIFIFSFFSFLTLNAPYDNLSYTNSVILLVAATCLTLIGITVIKNRRDARHIGS